jgi:CheY-like chemotaxis protein
MALESILIGQGYELLFAASGPEALARAAERAPDLALLDVMMPGMDGFEVCRRLRADSRLAEVPVVLVTALDDRDSRLKGIEAGADDFITKPFDRAELRARVRTITRLNRYRRLLAERARFEWVVEQAAEGYVIFGAGDEIRYANPTARLLLGGAVPADSPKGRGFLDLARSEYRCEPEEAWRGWPGEAAGVRYLVRPESERALPSWIEVTVLSQSAGAEPTRLLRLRDVTDEIAARRDTWRFGGMVQHKLRTPLVSALTALELIADPGAQMSAAETAELGSLALAGVQRLRSEVEDILQYVETARSTRARGRFPLEQLSALGERTAHSMSIEALRDHRAVLRVADDGIHLVPEQLARAWVPYYQGEKYFTGEKSGMGLGLSMVASFAWEAGGSCRIHNRADRPGVVVELALPILPILPAALEAER